MMMSLMTTTMMMMMTMVCSFVALIANYFYQGLQNLYGRDSKFCATCKNGTEKHRFSVPRVIKLISQSLN